MTEPFLFTPDTNIEKALDQDDRVGQALKSLGLKCLGRDDEMCVAASVETLKDAALYHDIPLEKILSALNALGIVAKPPAPPSDDEKF